jgi:hypothetical protein
MVVTFGSSLRTPPSPAPGEEDEDEGECCQNFETYDRDAALGPNGVMYDGSS